MIFNQRIDRLMEVDIVQEFMYHNDMQGRLCGKGDSFSLILYRMPYVVEFHDALIENYLEITLSDISAQLLLTGGRVSEISFMMNLQNFETLKLKRFNEHPKNDIFLSESARKMFDLHSELEAIDKLLPLIELKDGLNAMRDGSFDVRFDFKDYVNPMYFGLKDKYLNCINKTD